MREGENEKEPTGSRVVALDGEDERRREEKQGERVGSRRKRGEWLGGTGRRRAGGASLDQQQHLTPRSVEWGKTPFAPPARPTFAWAENNVTADRHRTGADDETSRTVAPSATTVLARIQTTDSSRSARRKRHEEYVIMLQTTDWAKKMRRGVGTRLRWWARGGR